jgi:hydrogenase expression/formation protein HypE
MEDVITLSHGSGGEQSENLIKNVILPKVGNSKLNILGDGASLSLKEKLPFQQIVLLLILFFSWVEI